jgi:hypothetical protein
LPLVTSRKLASAIAIRPRLTRKRGQAELFARCLEYLCLSEHKSSQRRFDQFFLLAPAFVEAMLWRHSSNRYPPPCRTDFGANKSGPPKAHNQFHKPVCIAVLHLEELSEPEEEMSRKPKGRHGNHGAKRRS